MIGQTIGHYKIVEKLGAGGMGEVYRAEDTTLKRQVALKVLPPDLASSQERLERFQREAETLAALDHPNIVYIHTVEEADGVRFLTMQLVDGKRLSKVIPKGGMSLEKIFEVAIPLADALSAAHEKGVVHRDLKPANIMLTSDGRVKVLDFGLAKLVVNAGAVVDTEMPTEPLTEAGKILGTVPYMSPEQLDGAALDARTDIFSLGVILYQLATGERPFKGEKSASVISAIMRDDPETVDTVKEDLPHHLGRIINHCLEKDPEDRFQSIKDVRNELKSLKKETETDAISASEVIVVPPRPTRRWRWPLVVTAGLVIVAGALVLATAVFLGVRSPAVSVESEAPTEPVSVLVADFDNQTGEVVFHGALEQAFSLALEGDPFIEAYERPRARQQAGDIDPEADGHLDARLAQLVSRSQGIEVVVAGSIAAEGESYRIGVEALDPVTGDKMGSASKYVESKADVLRATDFLASELRSQLSGREPESTTVLAEETFTTSSLEAMNAYAEGQELVFAGKYEEAIGKYTEAAEHDTDFGRAYAGLAVMHYNLGNLSLAEEYYQEALARIDRMTEREKYRTRGSYYLIAGNHAKAVEEYTELVRRFPADSIGTSNVAFAHFRLRDMTQAMRYGERSVELNPKGVMQRNNLALYAMYAGDFARAGVEARQVLEMNPAFEKAFVAIAISQLASGNREEAEATYLDLAEVSERGEAFAALGLADLSLYQGELEDAVVTLESAIAEELPKSSRLDVASGWIALGETFLARGEASEAKEAADQALAASAQPGFALLAAQLLANSGDEEGALAISKRLASSLKPDPQAYSKLIAAEVALARGDPQGALRQLQEARELSDTWLGRLASGRAYLEAGAFTEAYAEFELCLKRRGEATAVLLNDRPTLHYLPDLHYYLGRTQEGLGSPAAADSYRTFLAFKTGEGGPAVEDARRRLESL